MSVIKLWTKHWFTNIIVLNMLFIFILWISRKHHLDSHKPKSKKKKRKKHSKDLDDEYNKNKPKNPRVRVL